MELRWIPKRSIALAISLSALALLVAGIGAGYAISSVRLNHIEGRLQQQHTQILQLHNDLMKKDQSMEQSLVDKADLKSRLASSIASKADLAQTIKTNSDSQLETQVQIASIKVLLDEKSTAISSLNSELDLIANDTQRLTAIQSNIELMTNDRLLLVELRKDIPTTQAEAEDYWATIKELAIKSDPALGPMVSRVIRMIPTFFDWAEGSYSTTCEELEAYYNTGAVELARLEADLQKDVLLVLINRIDAAAWLTH